MKLIGLSIYHKILGEGVIIGLNVDTIEIKFCTVVKKFPYPLIFNEMITIKNTDIQNEIMHLVENEKRKQQINHELLMKEYENRFNSKVNASPKNLIRQQQKRDSCGIAIKCNYCDGGKSKLNIGFHGVCSEEMIDMNINTLKRTWCNSDKSACKQYSLRAITRKELDNKYKDDGFVCYESRLFRDWIASAGRFQSEFRHDEPMKMINARVNRLCVLTTRYPLTLESERKIIAVFIIKDVEQGDDSEEGYVRAHDIFRIQLNDEEAMHMAFWKYYRNKSKSQTPTWNSGLFRYITDIQSTQILRDIKKIKHGTEFESLTHTMLEYFCEKNSININSICDPSGAIDY